MPIVFRKFYNKFYNFNRIERFFSYVCDCHVKILRVELRNFANTFLSSFTRRKTTIELLKIQVMVN